MKKDKCFGARKIHTKLFYDRTKIYNCAKALLRWKTCCGLKCQFSLSFFSEPCNSHYVWLPFIPISDSSDQFIQRYKILQALGGKQEAVPIKYSVVPLLL
jgi:hypothetical protein